jgi:tryptophan-rich sensory protein
VKEAIAKRLRGRPLAVAVGAPGVAAVVGALLTGEGVTTWYAGLEKPDFLVPLPVFYVVGAVYYLLFGIVLYRILTRIPPGPRGRLLALTLTVMVLNELWNVAFFGLRSPFAGFVGMVVFLVPVVALFRGLRREDGVSAALVGLYALWVVYDVAWSGALWLMNP